MTKPVTIPNVFQGQSGNVPVSQIDTNFSTLAAAINDPSTYSIYAPDTGIVNAYVLTLAPAPTSQASLLGVPIQFVALNSNTGASTLNINSFGVAAITDTFGNPLVANAMVAGGMAQVFWDGTKYQLITSSAPILNVANTWTALQTMSASPSLSLTGGQLKFPATQIASADVNTLDDYIEGSFAGVLTGGTTGGSITCKYVKIGKSVTLTFPATSWAEVSNATFKRITGLSSILFPSSNISHVCFSSNNGGATVVARGVIFTSGVWECYATAGTGAWTASGNMSLEIPSFSYTI